MTHDDEVGPSAQNIDSISYSIDNILGGSIQFFKKKTESSL